VAADKPQLFTVRGDELLRLDKFLAGRLTSLSRTYLQRLIKEGRVTVNGEKEPSPGRLLTVDEKVALSLPQFAGLPKAVAEKVPVLFEDSELIVVDKPAGVVVHPAGPHQEDTLVQQLWPKLSPAWAKTVKDAPLHTARPGVVHRLDKGTSGVIVVAKTPKTAEALSRQFAERSTEKIYWALVEGNPGTASGVIRSNVGRDRRHPHKMSTTAPGRLSELEFKVVARFENPAKALLEVHPLTGRTHQIRVQLASLKHPLVGDTAYGGERGERPLLHALSLSFTHPKTKKRLSFSAPLPPDFRKILKKLGFDDFPGKKLK
jgi:23S rRNA pseudouridine1911/1915/1917 synthase